MEVVIEPITVLKALGALAVTVVLLGVLTVYFGNLVVPIAILAIIGGGVLLWRRRSSKPVE